MSLPGKLKMQPPSHHAITYFSFCSEKMLKITKSQTFVIALVF